jgi:tetratricopeptide (TPR) repeat protein
LWDSLATRAYAAIATNLQPLADSNPNMMIYPAQQAFLWGLAAHEGDTNARQQAIAAYARVIVLEPYYAPYHANLAALYWDAGDQQQGLAAMQRAVAFTPGAWQLQYQLGLYAEALGQVEAAQAAYVKALETEPDADLHPDWGQTPLQAAINNDFESHSIPAQVYLLMEAGNIDAALDLWESELAALVDTDVQIPVLRTLLALAQGDGDAAQMWYARAAQITPIWETALWLRLAEARIAQFDGDSARAQQALAAADLIRAYDPLTNDYYSGPDMAYYQYMHLVIPRQFLPQVFYPLNRLLLLYILDAT